MAVDTAVNSQITDAVTQVNVKVLGDGPAVAVANLYQATAQALANAAHNATSAQQQTNILAQSVTAACVKSLLETSPETPHEAPVQPDAIHS
jgi:hypothetical protein